MGGLIDSSHSTDARCREIEGIASIVSPPGRAQFEVFVPPTTRCSRDLELVAEAGRRETLSPDTVSEEGGGIEAEKLGFETPVGLDHSVEVGGGEQGARRFLERIAKTGEILLAQGEPGCGGVAPELEDQAGMTDRNAVERIAQVQSRDGAPRTADLTGTAARESEGRAVKLFLDTAGDDADNPLVPVGIEQAQMNRRRSHVLECSERAILHFRFNRASFPIEVIELPRRVQVGRDPP